MKLSGRMRAVAGLVRVCGVLADVGTDHGYLPAALLLAGRIRRAVASDVGAMPLDRARRTAAELDLEEKMELRLGDGLSVLRPGEADAAVIAGMGGDTIVSILSAASWCRERGLLLLLQPMSRAEVLRRWLPENGFALLAEKLVQDKGVLYPIFTVQGGEITPIDAAAAWGGVLLEDDPLWGLYLEEQILRLRKAAAGLVRARDPALAARRDEFLRVVAELEIRKGAWERANRARN